MRQRRQLNTDCVGIFVTNQVGVEGRLRHPRGRAVDRRIPRPPPHVRRMLAARHGEVVRSCSPLREKGIHCRLTDGTHVLSPLSACEVLGRQPGAVPRTPAPRDSLPDRRWRTRLCGGARPRVPRRGGGVGGAVRVWRDGAGAEQLAVGVLLHLAVAGPRAGVTPLQQRGALVLETGNGCYRWPSVLRKLSSVEAASFTARKGSNEIKRRLASHQGRDAGPPLPFQDIEWHFLEARHGVGHARDEDEGDEREHGAHVSAQHLACKGQEGRQGVPILQQIHSGARCTPASPFLAPHSVRHSVLRSRDGSCPHQRTDGPTARQTNGTVTASFCSGPH